METAGVTPAPENAHHLAAGLKPHLLYKCLLIQRAQKLKKPAPVYQTQKEGSEHLPVFRSTVWVDGVSYTSSNTFRQRKNAEMDVSRVAYIAITQKDKTDAMNFVREDKIFCKSVMAEYATKKNIGRPVYKTTQPEASLPIFRSNMVFNGYTYPGDSAKSKKEAEQLVARSVIIRFLASESGTDMADVVNSKFRQYQQISTVQIDSNAAVFQPVIPQLSVEQTAPTDSVALQQVSTMPVNRVDQAMEHIPHVSTDPMHPVVPVVTQQPSSQVSVVAEPLVCTPVPSVLVNNSATANVLKQPKPEPDQQPISQVLVEQMKPVVAEPLLLNPVLSSLINNSATANVMKQPKAEPDQAMEFIPLVDEASDKKRSSPSNRNARKKMRGSIQMPMMTEASQYPPYASQ